MQTLSVFLIVKNEEKFIKNSIEHLLPIAEQIVIVDTGSTDNTLNILKNYDVDVFNFEWCDNFSKARNFALSKCNKDLILYIDADEKLTDKSIQEINEIKKSKNPTKTAYLCKVKSFSADKNIFTNQMSYPRLFNRSENIYFEGAIHEQILPSLIKNKYVILNSTVEIIHYGYDIDEKLLQKKAQRNLNILLKNPEDNWYYHFQLAQTYSILKNEDYAFFHMNKAIEYQDIPNDYLSHAARYIADYYLNNLNFNQAYNFIAKGLAANPSQPLLNLVAANYYAKINDFDKFYKHLTIAYVNNNLYLTDYCTSSFEIFLNPFKIIFFALNIAYNFRNSEVLEEFILELKKIETELADTIIKILNNKEIDDKSASLIISKFDPDTKDFFCNILQNYKHHNIAKNILLEIFQKQTDDTIILNALGNIFTALNDFKNAIVYFQKSMDIEPKLSTALYLASIFIKISDSENYKKILSYIRSNNSEIANKLPNYI